MGEVSKKILFSKDAEYNGVSYKAGVAYDLPVANGYADRWLKRGHVEVADADPAAEAEALKKADAELKQKEKDEKEAAKKLAAEAKQKEKDEKEAAKKLAAEAKQKEKEAKEAEEYAALEAEEKAKLEAAELASNENQDNGASAL